MKMYKNGYISEKFAYDFADALLGDNHSNIHRYFKDSGNNMQDLHSVEVLRSSIVNNVFNGEFGDCYWGLDRYANCYWIDKNDVHGCLCSIEDIRLGAIEVLTQLLIKTRSSRRDADCAADLMEELGVAFIKRDAKGVRQLCVLNS